MERGLGGCFRALRRGFVPEAKGLAYREEHPEAGGGRAGHAAEPQPGPGPGRGSQRKARRRERWPRVPASFSQAARTHWPLPAEAGHQAPELDRTAHVPVSGWRGVRVAGLSAGDTWGLLMPRAWARRKISEDSSAPERRERKRESAQSCALLGQGRAAPRAPPTALCAPRPAPCTRWPVEPQKL